MKNSNEQSLSNVIKQFLQVYNLESKLDEIKIIDSWKKVVGKMIHAHTMDLSIENSILFVKVDSDALRNELTYTKSLIIKNLNQEAEKEIIKDIVFR